MKKCRPHRPLQSQAFRSSSPDRNNIPGYIPNPTRPQPIHRRPVGAPQGVFGERPTQASGPQQQSNSHATPTAHTLEELTDGNADGQQTPTYLPVNVIDMAPEDQPPTYLPEEGFSTSMSEAAPPTATTAQETAPPTLVDLTNPTTIAESPATTLPPTTQPPSTRSATRKPYTFPPFRRRTTPAASIGTGDATNSPFAPEFGTRITHRRPSSSSSEGGVRRRRPGGRRRPSGGAGSARGTRRRPGLRRRPMGGRRSTTPEPYTTTSEPSTTPEPSTTIPEPSTTTPEPSTPAPTPVEVTTALPTVEMTDDFADPELEQIGNADNQQQEDNAGGFVDEQGLQDGSKAVLESAHPPQEVGGFNQQEMPIEVMTMEEIPVAPVPEEAPVEIPVDEMTAAGVMSGNIQEHTGPVVSAPEEMHPVEIVQEEMVPADVTQEATMSPFEMILEHAGNSEIIPEEVLVSEPNPQAIGPIEIRPIMSEVSQSTAEPMTEETPNTHRFETPTIDIRENPDISVPPGSDLSVSESLSHQVSEGETPLTPELPGGIFHAQPAVPGPQEDQDVGFTMESEELVSSPAAEFSQQAADVMEATEPSEELGNDVLNEAGLGPSAASETRELSVEENGLGDFGAFSEADTGEVDVSAILREELGDDSALDIQTAEADFSVANAGAGDNFSNDETLQSLDEVPTPVNSASGFAPFLGFSGFENNEDVAIPSMPHQQEASSILTPADQPQGSEMDDANLPATLPAVEMPNTEGRDFGMPEAVPPHMMTGVQIENNGQHPGMFDIRPETGMFDASMPSDTFDVAETPSVMSQMDINEREMPSEMPEMLNTMPSHTAIAAMPMEELDNIDPPVMEGAAPETMVPSSEMEDDIMMAHPTLPESIEGGHELQIASGVASQRDLMPNMPVSEGMMSMPHEDELMSQDAVTQEITPSLQNTIDMNQDEPVNPLGEASVSFDMTMPSGPQSADLPENVPTSFEPQMETMEAIPQGFGPPHTYSMISESEESLSDGPMMSSTQGSTADDFLGTSNSVHGEPLPPVEGIATTAGESTMTMPESDDAMIGAGVDIRGDFPNSITMHSAEGELSTSVVPDVLVDDQQVTEGWLVTENLPEAALIPDLLAQPTSETYNPADEISEIPSAGSLDTRDDSDTAGIESAIFDQSYQPSQENQQIIPDESIMGSTEDETLISSPEQPPYDTHSSNMNEEQVMNIDGSDVNGEQPADDEIRVISEPGNEIEELTAIPSELDTTTEPDADVVDVVPEVYASAAEEPDVSDEAHLQSFSPEEEHERDDKGSLEIMLDDQEQQQNDQEQQQYDQEQQQETNTQEQEDQGKDQEFRLRENQAENLQTEQGQETEEDERESEQESDPHAGYGPPHSDTIVADDVTADATDDVTADATDDVTGHDDVTAAGPIDDDTTVPPSTPEQTPL